MVIAMAGMYMLIAFGFAYTGGRFDDQNESMADVAGALIVALLWPLMLAYIAGSKKPLD